MLGGFQQRRPAGPHPGSGHAGAGVLRAGARLPGSGPGPGK
jgi:hypothetical protein